jgi:hypothetical protein
MNATSTSKIAAYRGFFIAAFDVGGNLEGLEHWAKNDLSTKWTVVCQDLLDSKGNNFQYVWKEPLSHVGTKFSSARGAAICSFEVNNQIAMSMSLLSGRDEAADADLARLFFEFLQKLPSIHGVQSADSFAQILSISERPLMVAVPYPVEAITDQDHKIVQELSLHLASAYFQSIS